MEYQWPLVIFTVLAGGAGWLLFFTALNELTGTITLTKVRDTALPIAIVMLIAGGISSALHLSHPERMMGALAHPTMGIFTEALFVGLCVLVSVVFMIMVRREASTKALKAVAVVTLILGLVLNLMLGYSYMMASRPEWDTLLLPLAYFGTASIVGATVYQLIAVLRKVDEKGIAHTGWNTMVMGVLAGITAFAYAIASGALAGTETVHSTTLRGISLSDVAVGGLGGSTAVLLWVGVLLCGAVIPVLCGFLIKRKPEKAVWVAVIAVVSALLGCGAFRCFMWAAGIASINMFQML